MDTVFIKELRIETIIGCYAHEKNTPQPLVFDIEMAWDIRLAAKSDDLADALDYAKVCQRIEQALGDQRFELLESLAEYIVDLIKTEFVVPGIRLRVSKPAALQNAVGVGVSVARGIAF